MQLVTKMIIKMFNKLSAKGFWRRKLIMLCSDLLPGSSLVWRVSEYLPSRRCS